MHVSKSSQVFEDLYALHAADVFRFALYLCGNATLAQDLTAETFVRAFTANTPIAVSTAKAYLFTIARNLYLSHCRRQRPEVAADQQPDLATDSNLAVAFEHRAELAATLADLKQVAEADRAALLMVVFSEITYDEAAKALGISLAAVKARVFRARLQLTELRNRRHSRRPQ